MTCIHPKYGIPSRLPFNRLQHGEYVTGVGGRSERFAELAILALVDADGAVTYVYEMDIRGGKPEQVGRGLPSLLGQDVLGRWVMVHDPVIGRLQFQVRSTEE